MQVLSLSSLRALYNSPCDLFFHSYTNFTFGKHSFFNYYSDVSSLAKLIKVTLRTFPLSLYPHCWLQYPISEVVRHLAFEGESEAAEFCVHHGLAVHDGQVAIDRRAFVQPEQAFGARRSAQLVESKQTTSVGEVKFCRIYLFFHFIFILFT